MNEYNRSIAAMPPSKYVKEPLLGFAPSAVLSSSRKPAWIWRHEARLVGKMITSNYLSFLLLVVPFGIMAGIMQWNVQPVFFLNLVALIPLALLLGDVTEDLAEHVGDVVGGLLNATFGNVVEVVLAVSALSKGLFTVVASSLLGSILSNLLLVLGFSMLVGGMFTHVQLFSTASAEAHSTLLFLAVIGIAIPTSAGHVIPDISPYVVQDISRVSAVIMMLCYICYLAFQLVTHPEIGSEPSSPMDSGNMGFMEDGDATAIILGGDADDEGGAESDLLSVPTAIVCLVSISLLVAVHCQYLTDVIADLTTETGLSQSFIGMIVLPIAGNACEHAAAVMMAARNKMDLALGIAIGSSLQIALFAIPFVVLVGWGIGQDFCLEIDVFALLALIFSVVHANLVIASGRCNWLTGITLIAVYILIATTYFFRT